MTIVRLTLLFSLLVGLAFTAEAQTKRAFIVGVSDYETLTDLQKTIGDAEGYSATFRNDLGFEVTTLTDPTFETFLNRFAEFVATIEEGDEVAFIFSGHGWSDGAINYLALKDAPRMASETVLKHLTVKLNDTVLADIRRKNPALVFAIIDACRDNPFDMGTRSQTKGLVAQQTVPGSLIVYAAGANQKALDRLRPDDPSPYSVFTRTLLPKLRDPGQSLMRSVDQARQETAALAQEISHNQRPAVYSDVSLDFCFAGAGCHEARPRLDPETQDWIYITSGGYSAVDPCEKYARHLETYPNGMFATVARQNLESPICQARLAASVGPVPSIPEPEARPIEVGGIQWTSMWAAEAEETYIAAAASDNGGWVLAAVAGQPGQAPGLRLKKFEDRGSILFEQDFFHDVAIIPHDIMIDAEGDVWVSGTIWPDETGRSEGWLLKLAGSGGLLWERTYDSGSTVSLHKLHPSPEGGVFAFGSIETGNENDIWALWLDDDGDILKESQFGVPGRIERINAVADDNDINVWIGGSVRDDFGSRNGAYVAKLFGDLSLQWQRADFGGEDRIVKDLTLLPNGDAVAVGAGPPEDPRLDASGAQEGWIARIDEDARLVWEHLFGTQMLDDAYNGVEFGEDGSLWVFGETSEDPSWSSSVLAGWWTQYSQNGELLDGGGTIGIEGRVAFRDAWSTENGSYQLAGIAQYSDEVERIYLANFAPDPVE